MRFVNFEEAALRLYGKTVAVVGSAPSVLDNAPGVIDSHEVVVRVNNYKLSATTGYRTDVHYSFYGSSVRKSREELQRDGVRLCWCKCPDAKALDCGWHEKNGKLNGIDFRYIYRARANWWFCDTYVPSTLRFLQKFELLASHIPSTGFAAILDVLSCGPKSVYVTGFDFFSSGVHNVNEPWRKGDPNDPIGHRPDIELGWLVHHVHEHPVTMDEKLQKLIKTRCEELREVA